MALVPIFTGRITPDHRLVDIDRSALRQHLEGLQPGPVRFFIVPVEFPRSRQAEKYYRGVIVALLSEYTGYTPGEVHDELKRWYGIETTTDLNRDEYSTYIEAGCALAAQLSVVIPEPHTVYWGE